MKISTLTMEEFDKEITDYCINEQLTFDAFGGSDYTHFIVHGFTYNVEIFHYENSGAVELSTCHKARYEADNETQNSNEKTVSKLDTIFKYIDKYCYN